MNILDKLNVTADADPVIVALAVCKYTKPPVSNNPLNNGAVIVVPVPMDKPVELTVATVVPLDCIFVLPCKLFIVKACAVPLVIVKAPLELDATVEALATLPLWVPLRFVALTLVTVKVDVLGLYANGPVVSSTYKGRDVPAVDLQKGM